MAGVNAGAFGTDDVKKRFIEHEKQKQQDLLKKQKQEELSKPQYDDLSPAEREAIINNPETTFDLAVREAGSIVKQKKTQSDLEKINKDIRLTILPAEEKARIAADPNNPLNPSNPQGIYETVSEEGKLAEAERIQREALAKTQQQQISGFATEFDTAAGVRRNALAESMAAKERELQGGYETELGKYGQDLASSRQKTFEQANPYILEDLNRRGLLTSETAVTGAQADALKALQAQDEAKLGGARLDLFSDLQDYRERGSDVLNQFDTGTFEAGQDIRGSGLSALLGGNQEALDSALELRRGGLERKYLTADQASEQAFANSLARKKRRSDIASAAISAAGGLATAGASLAIPGCFDRWTKVDMPDGSTKLISEIKLGEDIKGGTVTSIRITKTDDMYFYKEVMVTGAHAVRENDKWIRVWDSFSGVKISGSGIVYNFITTSHRIYVNGIEFADEIEHDGGQYTSLDHSLAILNAEEAFNNGEYSHSPR